MQQKLTLSMQGGNLATLINTVCVVHCKNMNRFDKIIFWKFAANIVTFCVSITRNNANDAFYLVLDFGFPYP